MSESGLAAAHASMVQCRLDGALRLPCWQRARWREESVSSRATDCRRVRTRNATGTGLDSKNRIPVAHRPFTEGRASGMLGLHTGSRGLRRVDAVVPEIGVPDPDVLDDVGVLIGVESHHHTRR